MEKGHYGQYTGNARHSRKEEMIHDRELIYDTKKQLHNADQDYKHDSPAHRALVGDQNKLPGHLKKAISDAPAQMNADLAYDPINDRADSPMSMYGKKESPAAMYGKKESPATNKDKRQNKKLDRIEGRLDRGMKSKRQAERNLDRAEKITHKANKAGNFKTYNRATTAADQALDQYANFEGSPAKNMKNVLSGKQRY